MRVAGWSLVLIGGALAAALAVGGRPGQEDPREAPAARVPGQEQGAVWDLLAVVPFRVQEPYTHWWRAERPQVFCGHLLVLAVDPDVARPRQTAEPVLFVGDQTAERVNGGYPDGALVVIVPSAPDEQGWPAQDLEASPIWFGAPGLPEQVDAAAVARAQALAPLAQAFGAARLATALAAGGDRATYADQEALLLRAADLVERYAPSELQLVERLRLGR